MRFKTVWGALLLALALCGCSQQAMIQKFVLPQHDKAARVFFDDVRTGHTEPVRAATAPLYRESMSPALFGLMKQMFGPGAVKSITIVGARIDRTKVAGQPDIVTNTLTYEYAMSDRYVIGEIVLQDLGRAMQINGIHVRALTQSLEQINAFTLSGKNAFFLAFLVLAVLIPVFVVVTAVVCWRTPIPRFKWLWRLFVLLGIFGLSLNWSNGEVQFMPIHVNILGAGFFTQPFGPVILEIALPLGAILFWIWRRKWLRQADETAQPFS